MLLATLSILAFQDFKTRTVSLWLVLSGMLLIPIATYGAWTFKLSFWAGFLLKEALFNLCFLVLQVVVMWMYLLLRHGKPVNIFSYFGTGDLLFLMACALGFYFREFVLFVVVGALISIIIYGYRMLVLKKRFEKIPLVSFYAILYAVLILSRQFGYHLI